MRTLTLKDIGLGIGCLIHFKQAIGGWTHDNDAELVVIEKDSIGLLIGLTEGNHTNLMYFFVNGTVKQVVTSELFDRTPRCYMEKQDVWGLV